MRSVKVDTIVYGTLTLLRKTDTSSIAQRALCGYMIMAGVAHDPIYGGAFYVLRSIENAMKDEQIYNLFPYVSGEQFREIVGIAQRAMDGDFDKFAMPKREIDNTIKYLREQG